MQTDINVHFGLTLEDLPNGQLLFLLEHGELPLSVQLAVHRELTWRTEEVAARMPLMVEAVLRAQAFMGGRCHEPQEAA
jgi:hypothetical protein